VKAVESPALRAFASLAEEYCSWIDSCDEHTCLEILSAAHSLLARLYAAGLALPSTGVLFDDDPDDAGTDVWEPGATPRDPDRGDDLSQARIYRCLAGKLGRWNSYREVFDPYEPPSEAEVMSSLSDDLSDVHGDLRSGLLKWHRGGTGEALWEWRFGLENHWGKHATDALRALHILAAESEAPWPASTNGTETSG
jgi:hypothetical protein